MYEGDVKNEENTEETNRNAIIYTSNHWPKSGDFVPVPYGFAAGTCTSGIVKLLFIAQEVRDRISESIEDFNRWTCIQFIPRTDEFNYLRIIEGDGCWSWNGRQEYKNGQELSLGEGCQYRKGIATHELMHALGFMHEQSRYDRDDYVKVHLENVDSAMEKNFAKCNTDRCIKPTFPYDFERGKYTLGCGSICSSVLHYHRKEMSTNGRDTLTPIDPTVRMGQRSGMSETDIAKINELYECGDITASNNTDIPYPSTELTDGYLDCPELIAHCAAPISNYQYLHRCEKTCQGAKIGDPYDLYTNCDMVKDWGYCIYDRFKLECGYTCQPGPEEEGEEEEVVDDKCTINGIVDPNCEQ